MNNCVGTTVVFLDHEIILRLLNLSFIHTAKTAAIACALDIIQKD